MTHSDLDAIDDLIGELIDISSYEKDVIDREDLATMLIAAFGELSSSTTASSRTTDTTRYEEWASFANS